jgi:hypothetical protein
MLKPMDDTALGHQPSLPATRAGERGFVAGLFGALLVVLVDALVRVVASGAASGSYDLDFASSLSILVLAVCVVAAALSFARRSRSRARDEYAATEAQIARAETLIAELRDRRERG